MEMGTGWMMAQEQVDEHGSTRDHREKWGGQKDSQGGRHWLSIICPTFRKRRLRGGGTAKIGGLWQEWGGNLSGVKPWQSG